MSSPSEKRAAQRRATWQGGVARSFDEADELDLDFWRAATIEQRVTGMTQLLVEMSTITGDDAPPDFKDLLEEFARDAVEFALVGVRRARATQLLMRLFSGS